ncbi:MAG: DNA recombination protein RmuC [Anaerolineae bacterium]
MDTTLIALVGLLGLAVGAGAVWLFHAQPLAKRLSDAESDAKLARERTAWLEQAQKQLGDTFEALAGRTLRISTETFLERSASELGHLVKPLGEGLDKLDRNIRELEEKRAGAYEGLETHLKALDEAQGKLQASATTLNQALRSSGIRGRWGEFQLRRIVELAGMTDHVDFDEQPTVDGGRPDMLVYFPNGGALPIDAKAPMDAYLDATAAEDASDRRAKLKAHAKALRGRVQDLSRKAYWAQFDPAPPYVVMFVPNEACLSAAFAADDALLDYAIDQQILITSPVTLLALLKAVGYGWQQVAMNENARHIAQEGKELYARLSTFAEHLASVGDGLRTAQDAYNSAVGSFDRRLVPSVERFRELGISAEEIAGLTAVDTALRSPDQRRLEE